MSQPNIMSRIMSRRYHVLDMIPEWHDLGYEMTNNLDLYLYIIISLHIYQYHVISCDIIGIKRVRRLADLSVRGSLTTPLCLNGRLRTTSMSKSLLNVCPQRAADSRRSWDPAYRLGAAGTIPYQHPWGCGTRRATPNASNSGASAASHRAGAPQCIRGRPAASESGR